MYVKGTYVSIPIGAGGDVPGDPMSIPVRGKHLSMLGLLFAALAAGCASFTSYGDGILRT